MFTYRDFIILLLIAVLVGVSLPASAQPSATNPTISVISWNVESGVVDPAVIAQRLAAFGGANLWGLVEVNDTADAATFGAGVEAGESANFAGVLGTTGGGNVRAALAGQLYDKEVDASSIFMFNHPYRSDDDARHNQAALVGQWASQQTLSIIVVSDYNFDWDVATDQHDPGDYLLTAQVRFEWVQPAAVVTTQCSGGPCEFDSVLDFIFAGSAAQSQPLAVTIPHDHAGTELQSALSNRVHSVHAARPGCGDISFRNSTVLPRDPHRFDGNHEAIGYES